jgi:hypothetical protein
MTAKGAHQVDINHCLIVIGAAILTSLLVEGNLAILYELVIGLSWVLVYRHPEYKALT